MGVSGLDSYVRRVPNGCIPVDMEKEIRNCAGTPTLVIYTPSLLEPLNKQDCTGILCGGRYDLVYKTVDHFLSYLVRSLGVRLVFFANGPCGRPEDRISRNCSAKRQLDWKVITELVDKGSDICDVKRKRHVPHNDRYPVELLAKQYGEFRVPSEGDCKKEMVAFANSVGALAIIANNSDFMVFEGSWRLWCATNVNFEKLTTVEMNKDVLRQKLGLESIQQMALLATLASSNNFLQKEETAPFFALLSNDRTEKLNSLAEFVRRPHDDVALEIFGPAANEGDLRERFRKGLEYYGKEGLLSAGIDLKFFKDLDIYKLWKGLPIEIIDICDDLQEHGPSYLTLSSQILLRVGAIVAFHRQPRHSDQDFNILTRHEPDFHKENHLLIFPEHVVPPTLEEMFSEDSDIRTILIDTKLQLYCWIISDTLDPNKLARIPPKLLPSVATIYLLYESQLIQLNEADLLLQVAYEIAFDCFDNFRVWYPMRLDPRAYRVALFYTAICHDTITKALAAVGLAGDEYPGYPLFDGVLFHNLYRMWSRGNGVLTAIEPWRIYKDVF